MATDNSHAAAASQQIQQPSQRGGHTSTATQSAVSPPSKRELASWWKKFRKTTEKDEEKGVCPSNLCIAFALSIHGRRAFAFFFFCNPFALRPIPFSTLSSELWLTIDSTNCPRHLWSTSGGEHSICQRCHITHERKRRKLHLWLCSHSGC